MTAAARPVKTVGIVPHVDRELAHELARTTAAWFAQHGITVRVPQGPEAIAGLDEYAVSVESFADGLDFAISIGGDGTMLHTVQLVYPAPVPVIGVDVGHLGYLTEIDPKELADVLPRLVRGDFRVQERVMLEVDIESGGPAAGTKYGLNEAVLVKEQSAHMIRLDVTINGSPFTQYAADGIIVATPTGSTAYSFSARGPIVSPALSCIMLTPLSPHMLFDRSLVLAQHEEVEFVICGRQVVCNIDGRQHGPLEDGDRVRCRCAPTPLQLATIHPRDFHQILKSKFGLPDR
jgi:NAD+ kinase